MSLLLVSRLVTLCDSSQRHDKSPVGLWDGGLTLHGHDNVVNLYISKTGAALEIR
ncbi:MAG: hypothetical protein V4578_14580 [Pseudomonadota bacterium]